VPKEALSARGRVVVSRADESDNPGPMRVPTLLSFANIAAHPGRSSAAIVCASLSEGPTPMHNAPHTTIAYVFDSSRIVFPKKQKRVVQHPCLSRERRAFCILRIVSR
jgi:hypothetical protein